MSITYFEGAVSFFRALYVHLPVRVVLLLHDNLVPFQEQISEFDYLATRSVPESDLGALLHWRKTFTPPRRLP